jgi:hypothetical protein
MGHWRGALSSGVLFATVNWMDQGGGPAGSAIVALSPGFCRGLPQLLRAGPVRPGAYMAGKAATLPFLTRARHLRILQRGPGQESDVKLLQKIPSWRVGQPNAFFYPRL